MQITEEFPDYPLDDPLNSDDVRKIFYDVLEDLENVFGHPLDTDELWGVTEPIDLSLMDATDDCEVICRACDGLAFGDFGDLMWNYYTILKYYYYSKEEGNSVKEGKNLQELIKLQKLIKKNSKMTILISSNVFRTQ